MLNLLLRRLFFFLLLRHAHSTIQWCPANCSLPQYSPLCEKNWLFIISTGRAGSTTLLHALNSVNGLHLVGETNIIGNLRQVYESTGQDISTLTQLQQLFYLINCPSSADCQSDLIFGGKEVHLTPLDIQFLKILFPCSRYILNVRFDAITQSKSAFHRHHSSTLLQERNSYLMELHKTWLHEIHGTFLMAMEDFSPSTFDKLLYWIGYRDCHFQYIGHFNKNGTYDLHSRPRLSGACKLSS